MSSAEKMDTLSEIVRALEWAKRTGRLEYTRRTNLNGDYCDGVDAFDRALTLARELRDGAIRGYAAHASHIHGGWEFADGDGTGFVPGPTSKPALLILSEPTP